jgi:integrase
MARVKLTSQIIGDAVCPPGQPKIDFFDIRQPGFMLEVRCSGGKTFYQRYTDAHGRTRQFKIGPAEIVGLSAARRKGRSVLAQAFIGDDPHELRKKLRATPTLSEMVHTQFLPHIRSYKRSWRTDETILRVHILPMLGSKYVDELRGDKIAEIVQQMQAAGYASGTTNRVVIVLRHVFNLARKWCVPGVVENPTAGIKLAPDVCRERFLSEDEAQRLIASVQEDENEVARDAIMLLLLTGARRNEITHAKWETVDWERRTLWVPRSKSGKPRAIALNTAAVELLRQTKRLPDNPYIFPTPTTGKPSPSLHFPWTRIRHRAGLPELRLHDLRHSFASFLVNKGVSLYIVQGLLGHTHSRYTQRYAHLTADTLLEAAETVGDLIGRRR